MMSVVFVDNVGTIVPRWQAKRAAGQTFDPLLFSATTTTSCSTSDYDMESANKVAPVTDTLSEESTKCNAKTMCHNATDYNKESIDDNSSNTNNASAESFQDKLEVKQDGVLYSQTDNG
jgi:hypothetical protein